MASIVGVRAVKAGACCEQADTEESCKTMGIRAFCWIGTYPAGIRSTKEALDGGNAYGSALKALREEINEIFFRLPTVV